MGRLPFDPERVIGPEPPGGPARRERQQLSTIADADQLSVSQVADLIKTTLEQRIPSPLRVVGEISNLKAQNHWYFSLKDDKAVISCVAWVSAARSFGFQPADGDAVVVTGHVSHYPPQGRTQFYVTAMQPVGAGALEQEFRRLCAELRDLGYFDEDRKKPLPLLPRRIAVITSATGAAVRDVIETARQRCPAVGLLVVDVRVQGEGASAQVARAIRWVDSRHARLGVEAILVTRGGGSIEDLWAFNERTVADATFACSLPIVAAIGHESDTTIIELVADRRASTPTQAAMQLVPSKDEMLRQVEHLEHRLVLLASRRVEMSRQRLEAAARHEAFRAPALLLRRARETLAAFARDLVRTMAGRLAQARADLEQMAARLATLRPVALLAGRGERVAVLAERLERVAAARVRFERDRLTHLTRELGAIDPSAVLGRGYSYTTHPDGRLIRCTGDVRPGDAMVTNVADGRIDSMVGRTDRARSRPRSGKSPGTDQMDLFGGSR